MRVTVLPMQGERRFLGVDTARGSFDTVDDETVILDSSTGVLTLLVGIGPEIWERLLGGADRAALLAEIADTYDDTAATDVSTFLDDLLAAGLVVAIDAADARHATPPAWSQPYRAPQIERYDDIADIMMMDPIHEVDQTRGWPRPVDGNGHGAGNGAHPTE
jgi:hypothetical protein